MNGPIELAHHSSELPTGNSDQGFAFRDPEVDLRLTEQNALHQTLRPAARRKRELLSLGKRILLSGRAAAFVGEVRAEASLG